MELREKIARALCLEAFAANHVDNWFIGFLCQADAALEAIKPILEERDALRAELDALRVALREIAWSNDSKWQADRARDVLGEEK